MLYKCPSLLAYLNFIFSGLFWSSLSCPPCSTCITLLSGNVIIWVHENIPSMFSSPLPCNCPHNCFDHNLIPLSKPQCEICVADCQGSVLCFVISPCVGGETALSLILLSSYFSSEEQFGSEIVIMTFI